MIKLKSLLENITVYHAGTYEVGKSDPSLHLSGYYPGLYVSTDIDFAKDFGKPKEFQLDANVKLWRGNSDQLKKSAQKEGFGFHNGNGMSETKYLISLGYDGMKRGKEIILFNPDKSLKKSVNEIDTRHLFNMPLNDKDEEDIDKKVLSSKIESLEKQLKNEYPQLEDLHIYLQSNRSLFINSIKVKLEFRKQGIGKSVIRKIIDFAKKENIIIVLSPFAEPRYKARLDKFYKDLGFINNKGRNKDYRLASIFGRTMYRKPN